MDALEFTFPLDESVRGPWRRLEASTSNPSFFRTPEWIEARIAALSLQDSARLRVWGEPSDPEALFAYVREAERLHHRLPLSVSVLTGAGAGSGAADHTGWTARPGRERLVVDFVMRATQPVVLRNLDPDLSHYLGEAAVTVETSRCPRLDLTTWHGPEKSVAKKNAYYRRRSEREGVKLSRRLPGQVTANDLELLESLHESRFGDRSVFGDPGLRIQQELLNRPNSDAGPIVVVATQGERTVGILWGLWFAGVFSYYQTGWLPELKALSLGTVLIDEAIETARELGATTFDFLRGPEEYKYRLGAADRVDETVLIPRGWAGRVLAWKEAARSRLRSNGP